MDISRLRESALTAFDDRLNRLKQEHTPDDFPWYPCSTLSNFIHLDQLLTGPNRSLLHLVPRRRVADIGSGDGELGFFLETLGIQVDMIDHGPTNYNSMRGIRVLKEALGSNASINDVDLDSQFKLPQDDYDLVFLLGILYHLKNPFFVLESLASVARYCLLSTRIARYAGEPPIYIRDLPVAYLLSEREANNDPTNFWIFSDAGLRLQLERSGWMVCDYLTVGDTLASNPAAEDHDERAFALLRSRRLT